MNILCAKHLIIWKTMIHFCLNEHQFLKSLVPDQPDWHSSVRFSLHSYVIQEQLWQYRCYFLVTQISFVFLFFFPLAVESRCFVRPWQAGSRGISERSGFSSALMPQTKWAIQQVPSRPKAGRVTSAWLSRTCRSCIVVCVPSRRAEGISFLPFI